MNPIAFLLQYAGWCCWSRDHFVFHYLNPKRPCDFDKTWQTDADIAAAMAVLRRPFAKAILDTLVALMFVVLTMVSSAIAILVAVAS